MTGKTVTLAEAAEATGYSIAFFRKAIRAGRLGPVPRADGRKNPHVFAFQAIRETVKAAGRPGRPTKERAK